MVVELREDENGEKLLEKDGKINNDEVEVESQLAFEKMKKIQ